MDGSMDLEVSADVSFMRSSIVSPPLRTICSSEAGITIQPPDVLRRSDEDDPQSGFPGARSTRLAIRARQSMLRVSKNSD